MTNISVDDTFGDVSEHVYMHTDNNNHNDNNQTHFIAQYSVLFCTCFLLIWFLSFFYIFACVKKSSFQSQHRRKRASPHGREADVYFVPRRHEFEIILCT